MAFLTATPRLVVTAVFVCLLGETARAQPSPIEANIKAVFLYNFSKYVTWPAVAIGERSPGEVRICVTANDGFFTMLKAAVEGEHIDGKPLVAVALDGLDAAKACQILYVGNSQSADGKAWLAAVRGQQVLTVADGALTDDTVIAFVRENNRIRFDINRAAGGRRNLNVSSKLLRLARQVRDR
ncbi:MAG: YfiR family protein [Cyanobacteria bacterium]|nr:YfiR family protein [Cyanobacteriota bacterium]